MHILHTWHVWVGPAVFYNKFTVYSLSSDFLSFTVVNLLVHLHVLEMELLQNFAFSDGGIPVMYFYHCRDLNLRMNTSNTTA